MNGSTSIANSLFRPPAPTVLAEVRIAPALMEWPVRLAPHVNHSHSPPASSPTASLDYSRKNVFPLSNAARSFGSYCPRFQTRLQFVSPPGRALFCPALKEACLNSKRVDLLSAGRKRDSGKSVERSCPGCLADRPWDCRCGRRI